MSPASTERDFDVVVVGGGHNGLTAAAQLSSSGVRVCVLERRSELGGMAATVEAWPGAEVDLGAEDVGLFRSDLIDRLSLENHGLELVDAPAFACAIERGLVLWSDAERAVPALEAVSKHDARRWPDFLRTMERLGGELEDLLRRPPAVEDLGALARSPELMRFLTAPVAQLLGEWFESEAVRAMLASLAVFGLGFGPLSQGTGALLLYQLAGTTALGLRPVRWVAGGSGGLARALERSAVAHGAVIQRDAPVERIIVERTSEQSPRAVGVELEDGERVTARLVLSNLDLRRTLFDLVGAEHLELRIVRRVRSLKYRGAVSRLVVEIDGPLELPPRFERQDLASEALGSEALASEALSGRLLSAPSVAHIEKAADAVKYGAWSERPVLDLKLPAAGRLGSGISNETLLTINAQYAPFQLARGSWDDHRETWRAVILAELERAWPGLCARIRRQRLWTPADYEAETGASEGSPTHGEMSLGQLLVLRPLPGAGGCATSIDRLLLCGAGAHPGGGVTGLPGARAADQALELL